MKKEKGFTLIELLAVIVILAIISLIAIPSVLKIIEKAQMGSARVSAINYIKEINRQNLVMIDNQLRGKIDDITKEKWLDNVQLSGARPSSGYLTIDENGIVSTANLCVNNYNVVYEKNEAIVTGQCASKRGEFDIVDLTPGDLNCQVIDEVRTCYIESIEDIVAFSDTVNGINGRTLDNFANTKILLMNSLDFNNDLSYVDSKKSWGYDINGNNKIEGIKDELTNGLGFIPIASTSDKTFVGTFDGNGYTIKNLMIDRPSSNNVAMFGYNAGTIRGLNIKNLNVKGNNNAAGLVSINRGNINMINLEGSIEGTYAAAILSDGNYGGVMVKDIIVNASVKGTDSGGIVNNSYQIYGIIEGGTYSNTLGYGTYRNIGYIDGKVESNSYNYTTKMNENTYNNLSAYNHYVHTKLLGENADGYYFDYNDDYTDIIVKHTSTSPIDNTLQGSGTKEDPYLIYTENDMRKVATQDTTGKYYSLQNNLNYKIKEYYPIGTSSRPFKGTFDGNGYTISNITINGNDNASMFEYNAGTIRGLNIKNLNVKGNNNTAGLVSINRGNINMINLEGSIDGTYAAAILSDGNAGGVMVKDIIVNANVTGIESGGIVTNSYQIYGIIEGGTYSNTLGYGTYRNIGYISGKVTSINYAYTTKMDESTYNNLSAYNDYVQTILTGENDDGYYFDYNDDQTDIIVKRVNS